MLETAAEKGAVPVVPAAAPLASGSPLGFQTSIPTATAVPEPETSGTRRAMLYELQLGRLARQVIKVFEDDDGVLLPIAEVLRLAEIHHQVADGTIQGQLGSRGERFKLDGNTRRARIGKRELPVTERDLGLIDGVLYGSLALLGDLFGLSAAVDRETAAIFVYNPEELPIADRLRREEARAVLVSGEPGGPPPVRYGGGGSWNGAIVTYEVRRASDRPSAETAYDLGLATGTAAGALMLRLRGAGESAPRMDGAWTAIWPRHRWLTQLRVGDGPLTGPRPTASRGVSITNAPFARPVLVEDMPFAGALPPDWSIEAYRAGRLIGFDSVGQSGRYLLTLPVQYGDNPVDLVAYGPGGEIRTFNRTFRALPTMLPPGAFEYGISAGFRPAPVGIRRRTVPPTATWICATACPAAGRCVAVSTGIRTRR